MKERGKSGAVIAGAGLLAALLVVGVVVFVWSGASPDEVVAEQGSPSLIPDSSESVEGGDEAELLMEINQVIFEVTQEAIARPSDQRMTSEEIAALIRSRIEELKQARQEERS